MESVVYKRRFLIIGITLKRRIPLKDLYIIWIGTQIPIDHGKRIKFVPSQLTFA